MITPYDYLSIAFYLCFIAGVGIYFARRSKNPSDYVHAGGRFGAFLICHHRIGKPAFFSGVTAVTTRSN
jgi:Na+/proline symporter